MRKEIAKIVFASLIIKLTFLERVEIDLPA